MHYNPFAYLISEKDILKIVQTIITNTKGEGEKMVRILGLKLHKVSKTGLFIDI